MLLGSLQPIIKRSIFKKCPVGYIYDCEDLKCSCEGGIAPNQVIARSEFEVHRQIYME